MEKHIINEPTYAMLFNTADLRGLEPEKVTLPQAERLVSDVLGQHERWDNMCLELFPAHDSLLIFARMRSGKPSYFAFDGIENAISACRSCDGTLLSTLTYIDGEYIMTLYPENNERPPLAMSEFGRKIDASASYPEHLREYGREIVSGNAVELMKSVFA